MEKRNFNLGWTCCDLTGAGDPFGSPSKSVPVDLPHDAAATLSRTPDCPNGSAAGFSLTGDYQYEKVLCVPAEDAGKTFALEFEGVYMNAQVFVNDEYVGKCVYGYTCFYLDITRFTLPGKENVVRVIVKAGMNNTSRWYTGCGIYRNVYLHVGGAACFQPAGLRISTLSIGETARLKVTGLVRSESAGPLTAVLTVCGPDGQSVAQRTVDISGEYDFAAEMEVPAPQLWSPENPALYTLEAKLQAGDRMVDTAATAFGIRTVEAVAGRGLLLNGQVIKLRGGCVHHDNGPIGAAEYDDAALRRVKLMKEAGFNAIRSAHNPLSGSMLRACDRLGMLVMDESFDTWHTSKSPYDYTLYFDDNWKFDLEMLVSKDFNHPSVIMYTIGNEIQELDTRTGQETNRQLAEYLRTLDPTRIISNAVNGMFIAMKHMDEILAGLLQNQESEFDTSRMEINNTMTMLNTYMDDIMRHHYIGDMLESISRPLDVTGYNYMHGRYETDIARYPERIIVGSEARPNSIAHNWAMVEKHPNIIGDFVWVGWDYLGEVGVGKVEYGSQRGGMYGGYPWLAAYCGDLDICGRRRPQSYYREIVWGLRKAPYIAVQLPEHYGQKPHMSNWSWSDVQPSWTWPGFEGRPVKVEVYSDADEVELLLDGQSMGKKPVGQAADYTAIFDLTYIPGTLRAVAYRHGQIVGEDCLTTAAPACKLKMTADKTVAPADGQSLIYVDIATVDAHGQLNAALPVKTRIEVSGNATLLAFGSADPKTEEHFFDKMRTTWQGHLLAVLRAPMKPGKTTVAVQAAGLAPAQIVLDFA